jgi:hypothetical protein
VVEVAGIRDDVGNGSWPGDGSDGRQRPIDGVQTGH